MSLQIARKTPTQLFTADSINRTNNHKKFMASDCQILQDSISFLAKKCCLISGITCKNGRIIGIQLSDRNITGNISSSIGNLTQLLILDLSNNQLEGSIPATIANLRNLYQMDLSGNSFTGPIPLAIQNMPLYSNFNFGILDSSTVESFTTTLTISSAYTPIATYNPHIEVTTYPAVYKTTLATTTTTEVFGVETLPLIPQDSNSGQFLSNYTIIIISAVLAFFLGFIFLLIACKRKKTMPKQEKVVCSIFEIRNCDIEHGKTERTSIDTIDSNEILGGVDMQRMDMEKIMNYFKGCCGIQEKQPQKPSSQSMETIVVQPAEYPRVTALNEEYPRVAERKDGYAPANNGYTGYDEQPRVVVSSNPVSALEDQPRVVVH
ncbi:hypothetical protein HDV06_002486 [Boothiomyces sp. JEL0866]|nr:hypothetical protein HDV06_002486 [Boothiomyces sp. JEL0866]